MSLETIQEVREGLSSTGNIGGDVGNGTGAKIMTEENEELFSCSEPEQEISKSCNKVGPLPWGNGDNEYDSMSYPSDDFTLLEQKKEVMQSQFPGLASQCFRGA